MCGYMFRSSWGGWLYPEWCHHIVVILHSLFLHVVTAFPLPWLLFGIMLLSINKHKTPDTVRWLFNWCCSSIIPSLWDLFALTWFWLLLVHYDAQLVVCWHFIYLYIILLCVHTFTISVTAVVLNLIMSVTVTRLHICATVYVHMCVLCIDYTKCLNMLGQCSRMWPGSVFYFCQFGPVDIFQLLAVCAWHA